MNVDFLGELLDRVAAVAQDAGVAVDVGDGAPGGRGVDEALVVGGVAGLGQQRPQGDAVGSLSRMDDLQVKLAAGVTQGCELGVIGHRNPFVAGESALCPTKGSPHWRVHARVWTKDLDGLSDVRDQAAELGIRGPGARRTRPNGTKWSRTSRSVVRPHRHEDQPIDARPLDGTRGRSGQVKAPTPVMSRPTMRLWTCSVPS